MRSWYFTTSNLQLLTRGHSSRAYFTVFHKWGELDWSKNTQQQHLLFQCLQISSQPLSVHFSTMSQVPSASTSMCSYFSLANTTLMLPSGTDIALGTILWPCPPNRPLSWSQSSSWTFNFNQIIVGMNVIVVNPLLNHCRGVWDADGSKDFQKIG